jgi:hypothetical protein
VLSSFVLRTAQAMESVSGLASIIPGKTAGRIVKTNKALVRGVAPDCVVVTAGQINQTVVLV